MSDGIKLASLAYPWCATSSWLTYRSEADLRALQGGGIAVAFSAQFPHLVTDKVVLIASVGLMDVRVTLKSLLLFNSHILCPVLRHVPDHQVPILSPHASGCIQLSFPREYSVL